jgi:ubiquinone biosynthesis protein
MSIFPNFKILRRYHEIIRILFKYGFQDIIADAGFSYRARFAKTFLPDNIIEDIQKHSKWERMRMATEELGTTFIKFGQILSNHPDIIPLELVAEFEKLQNKVPPFSTDEAKKIIEEELGASIESIFKQFDEEPFASASIAQVHKAKLIDGTTVVIKVRRPDILEKINLDIEIMKFFSTKLVENGYFINLDPVGIVRAFENAIQKEIDLRHEGYNLQRFTGNFKDSKIVYVPKYYPKYTTNKILTMEFIDGVHPYDIAGLEKIGVTPHQLVVNGMYALFQQIFEFGFFHADPHPGNLFALPGNKVCFIDFGMMGTVLKSDVEFFADIVYGVIAKDSKRLIWGLKNIAISQEFDGVKSFEYDVEDIIQEYHSLPLDKVNITALFNQLIELANKYKIKMPSDYFLLSKCLITIEGVGRRVDPSLNIMDELKPHITKTLESEYSPISIAKKLLNSARDSLFLIENLPNDIRDIVSKVKKGEIKVAIEHEGLSEMTNKIDKASNRITGGFIIGCILIASAALIAVKFPPVYKNMSVFGALGFLIANILGLRILYGIFKNNQY